MQFIVWGSKGAPTGRGVGVLPGFISEPVRPRDKHHMTGKPTAVMRFLARFVTPGGSSSTLRGIGVPRASARPGRAAL